MSKYLLFSHLKEQASCTLIKALSLFFLKKINFLQDFLGPNLSFWSEFVFRPNLTWVRIVVLPHLVFVSTCILKLFFTINLFRLLLKLFLLNHSILKSFGNAAYFENGFNFSRICKKT